MLPLALTTKQSDAEIAANLAAQLGIDISHRQVKKARMKHRLVKRFVDPIEREARTSARPHRRRKPPPAPPPPMGPRIIQVGLPHDYHTFSPETQQTVKEALFLSTTSMIAAGYDFHTFKVTPEEGVEDYIAYLRSNQVDGVIIGAGIRLLKEMTVLLEDLVNATKDTAPTAKIMFITSPEATVEAAQRHFPRS